MGNTQNLNFDDGFMSFTLNSNPNAVIRFNPTDMNIIKRIQDAYETIEQAEKENEDVELKADGTPVSELKEAADAVEKYNKVIKDAIDGIFNSEISDIAFGKQSPVSFVGGGKFLWESFLECICKVIEKEAGTKIEASRKRIEKYKGQVYRR